MLTDLKTYLSERPSATLTEIARRFSSDPEALRPMLDHWVRKGKVRRTAGAACHGCASCAAADIEIYEWITPMSDATPHGGSPENR